jgi:sulfate adenylyltransferase
MEPPPFPAPRDRQATPPPAAAGAEAESDELLRLSDVYGFLRRNLALMATTAAGFTLLAVALLWSLDRPTYRAAALLVVSEPSPPQSFRLPMLPVEGYVRLLSSRPLLRQAARRLADQGVVPPDAYLPADRLTVRPVEVRRGEPGTASMLDVQATGASREEAAAVANACAETLIAIDAWSARRAALERTRLDLEDTRLRLLERQARLAERLEASRRQLAEIPPLLTVRSRVTDTELLARAAGTPDGPGSAVMSQEANPLYTELAARHADLELDYQVLAPQLAEAARGLAHVEGTLARLGNSEDMGAGQPAAGEPTADGAPAGGGGAGGVEEEGSGLAQGSVPNSRRETYQAARWRRRRARARPRPPPPIARGEEPAIVSQFPVPAHGGKLINLLVDEERRQALREASLAWPSWDLGPRQILDLELLANGAFSPLDGFLCRADYESVVATMRLTSGHLWPIPIALDVDEATALGLGPGKSLALRDPEGVMLAALHVEEVWQPDRLEEAQSVYGTASREHPGVARLLDETRPWYVGGRVEALQLPTYYDFRSLRHTPAELRAEFARLGWRKVVAFQTRNPMHRAHQELTFRAAAEAEANLLLHPTVGQTKPGDVDHFTRVRCYQALLRRYPQQTVTLSLLPLSMRMAGPREALWHAIIRKNHGASHFIVGRDHAGPGSDSSGKPFYGPYAAQELLAAHQQEVGVAMVPFRNMVYVENRDRYLPEDEVGTDDRVLSLSGTQLRHRLADGREIPEWFTFAEVAAELRRTHPPRHRHGFTVFMTGLSGAGKSTIANALMIKLLETGGRPVTLLDGDIVRKHLSSELGFSREHRDINIRRIGFVASEITKNGGIALCAPIAPYDRVRKEVRRMVEAGGGFQLVWVATPLGVCEGRDRKGLYAKARAGLVKEFTGISDPYEEPDDADVVLDTTEYTPEEAAQQILLHLERLGYIAAGNGG